MSDIVYLTSAALNTPSIASAATALAANTKRLAWGIQNLGQNALFILMGSGASATVFHFVLKATTANDDGTVLPLIMNGPICYQGIITIAGTTPRYTVFEIAP